jgi:hypothetical protein
MATLTELLATSEVLTEKLAAHPSDALRQRRMMVDFTAFGLFKQGNFWPNMQKALAWGTGVGLPLVGGGLLLENHARAQAEDLMREARNQALLTAMGVGGAQMLANKLGADETDDLRELAAALLLDDVLEKQYSSAPAAEKRAIEECLLQNREHGTEILRRMYR